jgi:two-component system, LytTR family, sensor kinase
MLQAIFSRRVQLVLHLCGWGMAFFVFYHLFVTLRGPEEGLQRAVVNTGYAAALFYFNAKILVNLFFERGKYWHWGIGVALTWILSAFLRMKIEVEAFGGSLFQKTPAPENSSSKIFIGYLFAFLILLIFSSLYQLMQNRRELEARHTEAQLNYLKAQINPHFLFNTLNNIYAAATLQHPRTPDMVLRLSELLRYVTYDTSAREVPLEKEIAQIRAYLELFQLKNETPLPIRLHIKEPLTSLSIEPLLLLPLVENALKHSDLETNPEAFLNIDIQSEHHVLRCTVENTFNPDNLQKDEVGGVGLDNIRQRIKLNHAGHYALHTEIKDKIFKAILTMKITNNDPKLKP